MCGIYGMISNENVIAKTMDGLKKLEYRGYDSSGIAFFNETNGNIEIIKKTGEIAELAKEVTRQAPTSTCAISHTRWATHGIPSDNNSHPHFSPDNEFVIVHNGIIENYETLKEQYLQGVTLNSSTDTEIAVQLIATLYDGNMLQTLKRVCDLITGSYAFAVISVHNKNTIYCAKKDSPLVVAVNENGGYVSSDISAIMPYTNEQYLLNNYEYCVVTDSSVMFYDKELQDVKKQPIEILGSKEQIELGNYPHFMLKEINEIPDSVIATVKEYDEIKKITKVIPKEIFKKTKFIRIIACGTAYHAGCVGKRMLEKLTDIKVEVEIASEFRYSNPKFLKDTLCLFISQSGETADTIAALKLCKEMGVKTLSVVNVKNSSITYESDYVIYTHAGREVAVASTKAYNTQMVVLYLLSAVFKHYQSKEVSQNYFLDMVQGILTVFDNKKLVNNFINQTVNLAEKYKDVSSIYLIGRQQDYLTAMESALKLKEISYIHCEAYPAGELKHGTISLIEKGKLVICFITQENICKKTLNAMHEVKSRGAEILLITNLPQKDFAGYYDSIITLPNVTEEFLPLISIIPVQILAYNISRNLGHNPDRPRNLAKSVTVE